MTDQLTERELQVAQLAAGGYTNKQIAARLVITIGTVDAHLRSIFVKWQVTNRTQLANKYHATMGD